MINGRVEISTVDNLGVDISAVDISGVDISAVDISAVDISGVDNSRELNPKKRRIPFTGMRLCII